MKPIINKGRKFWHLPVALLVASSAQLVMGAQPQTTAAQFDMTGQIQSLTLDGGAGCPTPSSALYNSGAYATNVDNGDADLTKEGRPALDCTATMVLNGQSIKLPKNTVVTLPASFLTPYELFAYNPNCNNPAVVGSPATCNETGLAISDTLRLPNNTNPATYEASVQGNIIYDAAGAATYVAGLVKISQEDLNSGDGFINYIDYATGDIYVGGDIVPYSSPNPANLNGFRLKITDPVGRFGRSSGPFGVIPDPSQDIRFAVDDGNPTISAETGYPMCIPRVVPPAFGGGADDPLCPQANRPVFAGAPAVGGVTMRAGTFYQPTRFCPPGGAPGCAAGARAFDPLLQPATFVAKNPNAGADPDQQAPLEVGDYIHYKGTQAVDATGPYMAVHTISANVGIYTTPGTDPSYMTQETTIVGLGPTTGFTGLQEGRELFKVVGFTTDVFDIVDISKVMTDPCTGGENTQLITSQWPNGSTNPAAGGAAANVPLGRFRSQFLKGLNLGVSMIPATKEIRVESRGRNVDAAGNRAHLLTANGLEYGQYQAPVGEYVFPENLGFGAIPIVPNNFGAIQFLSLGHGPWELYDPYGTVFGGVPPAPLQGQLSPWPGDAPIPATVSCTLGAGGFTSPAGPVITSANLTVSTGGAFTLSASAISPGGTAINPSNITWKQLTGTNLFPVGGADPANPVTLTAPAAAETLTFQVTATDNAGISSNKTVTVTVSGTPPDSVLGTAGFTQSYKTRDGSWGLSITTSDVNAKLTLHVFNDGNLGVNKVELQNPPVLVHTAGSGLWTYALKQLMSPLPVRPGETLPRVYISVTSDKGGSLPISAVSVK
jgi:hypothetical protein